MVKAARSAISGARSPTLSSPAATVRRLDGQEAGIRDEIGYQQGSIWPRNEIQCSPTTWCASNADFAGKSCAGIWSPRMGSNQRRIVLAGNWRATTRWPRRPIRRAVRWWQNSSGSAASRQRLKCPLRQGDRDARGVRPRVRQAWFQRREGGGNRGRKAAKMANHASTRTIYDRRRDEVSLDEVERIVIWQLSLMHESGPSVASGKWESRRLRPQSSRWDLVLAHSDPKQTIRRHDRT